MRSTLIAGLLVLFCAGCTQTSGHPFVRPDPAHLVLGSTTKSEIVAAFGAPEHEASSYVGGDDVAAGQTRSDFDTAPVAGTFNFISYHYSERTDPLLGATLSVKTAVFSFRDGTLISYNFTSNFVADSSNFDESRLSSLQKGTTTRAEVEQIVGRPTGQAIYPAVLAAGNKKAIYTYVTLNQATSKLESKQLQVLFDRDDRLVNFRFTSGSDDAKASQGGSTSFVPIIIPAHK